VGKMPFVVGLRSSGSIELAVVGGTAPYSILWSNGAATQNLATLPAGSYTDTISDAQGCSIVASQTLTQPTTALALASQPECTYIYALAASLADETNITNNLQKRWNLLPIEEIQSTQNII